MPSSLQPSEISVSQQESIQQWLQNSAPFRDSAASSSGSSTNRNRSRSSVHSELSSRFSFASNNSNRTSRDSDYGSRPTFGSSYGSRSVFGSHFSYYTRRSSYPNGDRETLQHLGGKVARMERILEELVRQVARREQVGPNQVLNVWIPLTLFVILFVAFLCAGYSFMILLQSMIELIRHLTDLILEQKQKEQSGGGWFSYLGNMFFEFIPHYFGFGLPKGWRL